MTDTQIIIIYCTWASEKHFVVSEEKPGLIPEESIDSVMDLGIHMMPGKKEY